MYTKRTGVVKTHNEPSVASPCYISGREVVHFGMGTRSEIFDLPIVQLLCSDTGFTNPIIPSTAMNPSAEVLVSTFGLQELHGSITPLYTIEMNTGISLSRLGVHTPIILTVNKRPCPCSDHTCAPQLTCTSFGRRTIGIMFYGLTAFVGFVIPFIPETHL
jgi:hypothetical protein